MSTSDALLFAGIILAVLTEAIASTTLSLSRGDIIGDTYATPDEFAWLDMSYTTLKLIGFLTVPWLMTRLNPRSILIASVAAMGLANWGATMTASLDLLIVLRASQGLAGGCLLVAGQAVIFLTYPLNRQPTLQALFATGAVVAPATIAPALQGWLLDSQSWAWIFFSVVPIALLSAGCLALATAPSVPMPPTRPFDWIGLLFISSSLFCFTYAVSQGSRWDWFEEPPIRWLTTVGTASLLAFLAHQVIAKGRSLLDLSAFQSNDFVFSFIVSFVAGAALFGSGFLIPLFAVSVLAFTPTAAGFLLLPSGALFICALLVAAYLIQVRRAPPFAMAPIGILMIMYAMWMLSGSTTESGAQDLMAPVLVRGLGLGFLFLSITLVAFSKLNAVNLRSGIGIFNTGRQLGGLMGVAGLQSLIDHHVVANLAVLSANLTAGTPAVSERLARTSTMLAARGMDAAEANRAATGLLVRSVTGQSAVIAFDTAFCAVALLFVLAAPAMVAIKIGFGRKEKAREVRAPRTGQ